MRRRALAAACAALAVFAALQVLRPPTPQQVTALVAARDLPAGTRLSPEHLTRVQWRPGSLPDGTLTQPTGRVLAAPVRRGEAITDARVLGAGLTLASPGDVALSVRISDAASLDLVRVGDAVDVIAVPVSGQSTETAGSSRVLVSRSRVLALPAATAPDPAGVGEARVVVLEVPRSKAVEISEGAARDWLSVVLNQ